MYRFLKFSIIALLLLAKNPAVGFRVPLIQPMASMIRFLANSAASVFKPMREPNPEAIIPQPKLRPSKSKRLDAFRRTHKKHKWDYRDMAEDFKARYFNPAFWASISDGKVFQASKKNKDRELTSP